jgi:hypothetical protein
MQATRQGNWNMCWNHLGSLFLSETLIYKKQLTQTINDIHRL